MVLDAKRRDAVEGRRAPPPASDPATAVGEGMIAVQAGTISAAQRALECGIVQLAHAIDRQVDLTGNPQPIACYLTKL